jgi:hypothetical protein
MTALLWYCLACYAAMGLAVAVVMCSPEAQEEVAAGLPGPVPANLVFAFMLAMYAASPLVLPALVASRVLRHFLGRETS